MRIDFMTQSSGFESVAIEDASVTSTLKATNYKDPSPPLSATQQDSLVGKALNRGGGRIRNGKGSNTESSADL